jgi:phage terminase large subunit GpA-like protein
VSAALAYCDQLADLLDVGLEALRPPPTVTVSEWAEEKRILAEDEAEPGKWRNARTPYLVEIMDRLSPHDPTEEVVFMKGAQIGGTEVGLNALGYWMDGAPGRILSVCPGEDEAADFSTQRVQPMIDQTPTLSSKIGAQRGSKKGTAKVYLKEFPGGSIKFAGSNAPAGLRSKPIRYLFGDEIDGWALDAGGEGDPMKLAEKRQGTYANRKRFYCSTPTVKQTSRIEPRFRSGDQRFYFVPCPGCGEFAVLSFGRTDRSIVPTDVPIFRFEIPKDEAGRYQPADAHFVCQQNGCVVENHDKTAMLAGGQWRATAPYNGWRRSYHLSSFYSPVGWLSWARIAEEWIDAQGDPVKLKVLVNTVFGETWNLDDGDTLDEDALFASLREPFAEHVDNKVGIITAGVDIQGDRIELEFVGWGLAYESWSLDYIVIPGDPDHADIWNDLDRVLKRTFTNDHGDRLRIEAVAVDSGHKTTEVYNFVKTRWKRCVWAIKGQPNDTTGKERPIWPIEWSQSKKAKVVNAKFKMVGVDTAKQHVYGRLARCVEPGPGFSHVPHDRPKWWFKQLTAERVVTKHTKAGVKYFVWELDAGARNEALDCRVYAYSALKGLESLGRTVEAVLVERDAKRPLRRQRELDAKRAGADARRQTAERVDFIPRRDDW